MAKLISESMLYKLLPKDKTYKVTIGLSLFLLVSPTGSKYWRYKYRYGGKEKSLSFGVFPKVSLKNAIAERDIVRLDLKNGNDPALTRKLKKLADTKKNEADLHARFLINNDGALSIRHCSKHIMFSPEETAELRRFLNSTVSVVKQGDC